VDTDFFICQEPAAGLDLQPERADIKKEPPV
jgi:hypothetical protein